MVKKNWKQRIWVDFRVNGAGLTKFEKLRWSDGGSKDKENSIFKHRKYWIHQCKTGVLFAANRTLVKNLPGKTYDE